MWRKIVIMASAIVLPVAAAQSQAGRSSGGDVVAKIDACRSIFEPTARLTCFDAAAAALGAALADKSIVVLYRETVRQSRRSLFGFNVSKLPFFGSGDRNESDETREMTATIASANALRHDQWRVRLQDGAIWQTTEAFRGYKDPMSGTVVTIVRGPLNSYMMKLPNQRAVRVARIN